jgi:hypothetical protein
MGGNADPRCGASRTTRSPERGMKEIVSPVSLSPYAPERAAVLQNTKCCGAHTSSSERSRLPSLINARWD